MFRRVAELRYFVLNNKIRLSHIELIRSQFHPFQKSEIDTSVFLLDGTVKMPRPKRQSSSSGKEPVAKKAKKDDGSGSGSEPEKIEDATSDNTFASDAVNPEGKKWNFKIVSWNVNGIRAWMQKDGLDLIKKEDPDIACIQETKCSEIKLPMGAKPKGYKSYFMSAKKEGYAGVAVYSKVEPESVKYGIGDEEHDDEGRSITLEYKHFYVVTAYVPNAGRKLVTLDKRMDWDPKFLKHLHDLDALKPVIMCGDLNVAHLEIDLANPKGNHKNAGFTKEERSGFSNLLSAGFIDSYRHLYPDKTKAYTFWTYMMNARAKNVGWRLDYFVLSEKLKSSLCDNIIRSSVMGSDHCPITLLMRMGEQ
uniref:DNA-(apurinic or apyrimidinic site) endonuclease n=2 Tax=Hirondellea gigas TaxID=1518452 RepID=A0A6A7FQ54_9CRUS